MPALPGMPAFSGSLRAQGRLISSRNTDCLPKARLHCATPSGPQHQLALICCSRRSVSADSGMIPGNNRGEVYVRFFPIL